MIVYQRVSVHLRNSEDSGAQKNSTTQTLLPKFGFKTPRKTEGNLSNKKATFSISMMGEGWMPWMRQIFSKKPGGLEFTGGCDP